MRVILHEHHPAGQFRIARELHDFADERLAGDILGMGFPRHHQLHRPGRVAQNALEPSQVPEDQGGPFVGGEAARESDGQRFRIQDLLQTLDFGRRRIAGRRAGDGAFPHERHHAPLPPAVRLPQFRVRDVGDLLPDFRLGMPFAPIRLQVLVVERGEVAIDPGGQMDPVGDGGNGDLPDREFRPQSFPHVLRNGPVQAADRVAVRGCLDGRDGHGEGFLLILRVAAPQGHQFVEADPRLAAIGLEVLVHQARVKQVDARRHGSMGREHIVGARCFQGFFDAQMVLGPQEVDPLDGLKSRVAFVHVKDGGLQPERLQYSQSADPQNDFLANPLVIIAGIELAGDVAMKRVGVLRDVAVHQIQAHAPEIDSPDFEEHGGFPGQHVHDQLAAVRASHRRDGQGVKVVDRCPFLLPSVGIERLPEIPALVQQSQAHQRKDRVAGRLEMIAGKHAQTAGVDRHAIQQPVFHRKVGHQHARGVRALRGHVGVQSFAGAAVQRQIPGVPRGSLQGFLWNAPQHHHGVVVRRLPVGRVQPAEYRALRVMPAPHQVEAQLGQPAERRGERWLDQEFLKGTNLKRHL